MIDPIQEIEENLRSLVGRAMMTRGKEGLIDALFAKDISNLLKLVKAYESYISEDYHYQAGIDFINEKQKEIFGAK